MGGGVRRRALPEPVHWLTGSRLHGTWLGLLAIQALGIYLWLDVLLFVLARGTRAVAFAPTMARTIAAHVSLGTIVDVWLFFVALGAVELVGRTLLVAYNRRLVAA